MSIALGNRVKELERLREEDRQRMDDLEARLKALEPRPPGRPRKQKDGEEPTGG